MIEITNASVYSTKGEIAYQITYSDGTEVRALQSPGHIVRTEYKKNGEWIQRSKPYVVNHSKARNAERIIASVWGFIRQCSDEV
jgi:hypothetical protein